MYYQNVRGLRTKLNLLCESVSLCAFDIIALTETWLNSDIKSPELGFFKYDTYRFDRSITTSCHTRGGGVLLSVLSTLHSTVVHTNVYTIEHVFVKFNFYSHLYIIGVFYIPPNSTIHTYRLICKIIEDVVAQYPTSFISVFGDFNLSNVKWKPFPDDGPLCTPVSGNLNSHLGQITNLLSDTLNFLNLSQINNVYNAYNTILDLIFYNSFNYTLKYCDDYLIGIDSYHPPLLFIIHINTDALSPKVLSKQYFKYDFNNSNFAAINSFVNNVEWKVLFDNINIDECVSIFYDYIYTAMDFYIPVRLLRSSNFPPWFNAELKRLTFLKKTAHLKFKRHGYSHDYNIFKTLRARCKSLSNFNFNSGILIPTEK